MIPRLSLLRSAAFLVCGTTLLAQNRDVLTPQNVASLRAVSRAVISPDAKHAAFIRLVPREAGVDEDGAPWTELWVTDLASGREIPFVTGKINVAGADWTRDGASIAFLSKRGSDKAVSLYTIPVDGGEARRVVGLATDIQDFSFSPDEQRVALVASEPESEVAKKRQEKGFKQEVYEEDWRPTRVWIAKLGDSPEQPRALPLLDSAHEALWSPVDERILVTLAPTPLVDDEYMRQRIRIVDPASGEIIARIQNPGKLGQVAWSPDGKRVALVSAADIHDPAAGRLMICSSEGGEPVDVLPGLEGDVSAIAWGSANDVFYVGGHGLWSTLTKVTLDASDKATAKILVGDGQPVLASLTLSKDGQHAAFVGSEPTHPLEMYTMSHGDAAPKRRTDSNPWLANVRFAPQENVGWKARDGLGLEGILVRPLDEKKGERYPLILCVHGGPEARDDAGWQTGYSKPGQMAAAQGIATFYPNYRGSTGRGVAFSELSQGDPGGKEFDDLVDAVDHLVSIGLVDKAKVGVTGGSYGGYATAWCSTKFTDRFAAGVMFVGISDKISKVGTTDIADEDFFVHLKKRPWDDWQMLLERSPIYWAGQSKTPLIILHGKDDPRVNPGQSRELYRHLKLHGQAPVRLVMYPGEGHGNRKACARLDYNLRMMQWMVHYLKGPGGAMPPYEIDYAGPETKKEEGGAKPVAVPAAVR
ncbi:MAG TPA: S9 family peptidase [Planctomycetota bacterium]|jgi:dipeptidyl aminopeptidase/acylaminoacyl peptidase|nr:S9 family peptidase [Planctomycetota bacterium]